ncbi:hypothetical protein K431DRAFT_305375 [Polychaeton citri CBS 116435]|uniref:Zn(2)-C6 fungal-type domain-containing protein n=1 Tax=Polychaeton citri CBS 116435 TaxID=1314669 RepID=A0A9P4Q475_9PEZI|nr:hypothetical protein K431DRAFT_305375 [Polychaeton citri CBS 116435]
MQPSIAIYKTPKISDGAGAQKRMRKGTRSCLACRQRKVRCTWGVDQGSESTSSCNQCVKHGYQCEPQGVVVTAEGTAGDYSPIAAKRPRKLRERAAQLEGTVEKLGPTSSKVQHDQHQQLVEATDADKSEVISAWSTTSGNGENYADAAGIPQWPSTLISRTLSSAQVSVSNRVPERESSVTLESHTASTTAEHGEVGTDEEIVSQMAPLIRLLKNPILGTSDTAPTQDASSCGSPAQRMPKSQRYIDTAHELSSVMPGPSELADIVQKRSGWWSFYRQSVDLVWGLPSSHTLRDFALEALADAHPASLALLLVCLTISTGDYQRYLPVVEEKVVNDDQLAGTEHGLACLMALGLCYLAALQPRRAWVTYRRANTLMQLNGLHLSHRRSQRTEAIFWQLFHADRWVSLMIGLPYGVHDRFCDVHVDPIEETSVNRWLYRQLGISTGRVIDHLQSLEGPRLPFALELEDQLESLQAKLPPHYLSLDQISRCSILEEQFAKLYRKIYLHLLKTYVHLPFLLRAYEYEQRYEFSRHRCLDNSQHLLEAYLQLFDLSPVAVSDGTVLNFNASFAATVLLLGLLGYGKSEGDAPPSSLRDHPDWDTIQRTMEAIKEGAKGRGSVLCKRSYDALSALVESASSPIDLGPQKITFPYFGTVEVRRKARLDGTRVNSSSRVSQTLNPDSDVLSDTSTIDPQQRQDTVAKTDQLPLAMGTMPDLLLEYHGPYTAGNSETGSLLDDAAFLWDDLWLDNSMETWSGDAMKDFGGLD